MYNIFIENGEINGAGEFKCLNPEIENIEVSETVYNDYVLNPTKYICENNSITVNPNFEKEKHNSEISEEINSLKTQIENLDIKRIRAICENEIKDTASGQTWLEYYNYQIITLREKIKNLNSTVQ